MKRLGGVQHDDLEGSEETVDFTLSQNCFLRSFIWSLIESVFDNVLNMMDYPVLEIMLMMKVLQYPVRATHINVTVPVQCLFNCKQLLQGLTN